MKLLISADMEGITGVVDWKHVDHRDPEYGRFRKLMTADVNAAIRGALKGGADQIVVTDAHGPKTNILIEELEPPARLNSGPTHPMGMVQGIDDGVDAVFFIGYHARNGAEAGILSHTISGKAVANVWINDVLVGEMGINAHVAGSFGAPVLLVSSDSAGVAEAKAIIPGVATVKTKNSNTRFSAEAFPASVTHPLIEAAAEKAVKSFLAGKAPKLVKAETPVRIRLEYTNEQMADSGELLPTVTRVDGRTVEFTAHDMASGYRALRAAIKLA